MLFANRLSKSNRALKLLAVTLTEILFSLVKYNKFPYKYGIKRFLSETATKSQQSCHREDNIW